MGDQYDPSKPFIYSLYLDKKNLYGWAMSEPLPYADYKCVEDKDLSDVDQIAYDILKLPDDVPIGFFLEVDF